METKNQNNKIDAGPSSFKQSNKHLYGLLMQANEKLDNVGTTLIWLLGVAVLALCMSIHMEWFDVILGVPVAKLQSIGVYALIVLATFVVFIIYTGIVERMVYRSVRPTLLKALRESELSVQSLLAEIADNDKLKEIREKIMSDEEVDHIV